MNKQSFLATLKEDKWFDERDKLIEYRLPVIQWYLSNCTNYTFNINGRTFESKLINIKYNPETDFTLVDQAWLKLKEIFKDELNKI